MVLADLSFEALEVANQNIERHGVDERVYTVQGDGFDGLPGQRFDLIVSNPPYVSERDFPYVMVEVRKYEPPSAVFAGESGIEVYERLIPQAVSALRSGGRIILELGYDVRERVRSLLLPAHWKDIDWRKDLAGHIRAVVAKRL